MAFRSLEDILGPLVLPIGGKTYTLPTLSLEDGVRLHALLAGETEEGTIQDAMDILLGDVREQMAADGLGPVTQDRVFFTALADFQTDREGAEKIWENGIPLEATAALVEAVKLAQMTPRAEAPTTPAPDSGNGTTGAKPKKTATRSRGRTSSQSSR